MKNQLSENKQSAKSGTAAHMVPGSRRRLCVSEAWRVLKPAGRLVLIDYAGALKDRTNWTSRHGLHGRFDLHGLHGTLSEEGFRDIDGGPLGWLGLHFLRGTKGSS